jgi:hypothetical protein
LRTVRSRPALADALPATSDNLQAAALPWRDDAATSRAGATLFYLAGHGIQRSRGDPLLLLSDFFVPGATLARMVDLSCICADGRTRRSFRHQHRGRVARPTAANPQWTV